MSASFVLCEKILSSKLFFSTDKFIQVGASCLSTHRDLDLIYEGEGSGDKKVDSITGVSTIMCSELDAHLENLENERLLVCDGFVNKPQSTDFDGSTTVLNKQSRKEPKRYPDEAELVSDESTKQDELTGASKDTMEGSSTKKRHQSALAANNKMVTQDNMKPLPGSKPDEASDTLVLSTGAPASRNKPYRTRRKAARRTREHREKGREEMSDSLRQYDTNKIWTFEGFRQTLGVPHGAGLINGRNTCFINAVLQTLVHIPPFTRYALEIHGHSDGPHKDGCLWCVMRRTHYPNILDHSDVYFAKWVTQLWPRLFQGNYCGSQEDAHEFFLKFVGALKSVQKRNRGRAKSPSSPIDRIFGGKSRYEMICLRCGDATVKHQDFLDLSLALPQGGYGGLSPTITELLALNIENEKIELRCAKCGCKWKKLSKTITRCPPVLVLHILRFTNYATKINMAIDVERNISLRQFTYLNDEEERYELTAAIFHLGPSPDRGHYTVMTKGFNGRFYYFDDEHVTPVRETRKYTVLSTYMLFYSHTKPQKCASATDRCLDVKSTTTSSVTRLDTKTAEDGTMPVEISCEKSKDIGMNSTEGDNENRLDESSYSEISCQNLKIAESETIDLSQSINSYSSSTESKRVKQNFKHTTTVNNDVGFGRPNRGSSASNGSQIDVMMTDSAGARSQGNRWRC